MVHCIGSHQRSYEKEPGKDLKLEFSLCSGEYWEDREFFSSYDKTRFSLLLQVMICGLLSDEQCAKTAEMVLLQAVSTFASKDEFTGSMCQDSADRESQIAFATAMHSIKAFHFIFSSCKVLHHPTGGQIVDHSTSL